MGNMEFETLLLSDRDIESLITMKDVVEIVDKTFKGFGDGTVVNPAKINLDLGEKASYPQYEASLNAMPAYIGWLDSAGLKWAGGFAGKRREAGLPYIIAMNLLVDPRMGNFKAVMDGAYITSLRTGAQAAVVTKYIHKEKDITIGLYGAGVQGHMQTLAMAELFNIRELKLYDISEEASRKFKEDMKDIVNGEIIICKEPREVADADVVVSFTHSNDGFIKDEWIKEGTLVLPLGSYQEVSDELILNADKIIVDHMEQCFHRGALANLYEEGKISEEKIYSTIGEIVAGKKEIADERREKIIGIAIGTGAMDVAVSTVVYEKALEKNVGTKFKFVENL